MEDRELRQYYLDKVIEQYPNSSFEHAVEVAAVMVEFAQTGNVFQIPAPEYIEIAHDYYKTK